MCECGPTTTIRICANQFKKLIDNKYLLYSELRIKIVDELLLLLCFVDWKMGHSPCKAKLCLARLEGIFFRRTTTMGPVLWQTATSHLSKYCSIYKYEVSRVTYMHGQVVIHDKENDYSATKTQIDGIDN